jgi:chromosome segregation ATPase
LTTDVIIAEERGENVSAKRKKLESLKSELGLFEDKIRKAENDLRSLCTSLVDAKIKHVDSQAKQLQLDKNQSMHEAGKCLGQAMKLFQSLGPDFAETCKRLQDCLRGDYVRPPQPVLQGKAEGYNDCETLDFHGRSNELAQLKRLQVDPMARQHYENRLFSEAIREAKNEQK